MSVADVATMNKQDVILKLDFVGDRILYPEFDGDRMRVGWVVALVKDEDEYKTLEKKMYDLISNGEIKNVRIIHRHVDSIGDSVVAVSPCTLSKEQWRKLEDLADLYDYAGYEDPCAFKCDFVVEPDRPSLDVVLHNLIRGAMHNAVRRRQRVGGVQHVLRRCMDWTRRYREIVGI